LADNLTIVLFQSMLPADRLPDLPTSLQTTVSVAEALAACGVTDFTRAPNRITAKQASATQTLRLRITEGAPILRTVSINVDSVCTPVEYGRTWFASDPVTLTLNDD